MLNPNTAKIRLSLLVTILVALSLAGLLAPAVQTVRASPSWVVKLDANSTSQTDIALATSASQAKSFRVGAVINASSAAPLDHIWGWQFAITYNSSAFLPQGDPSASSSYPDAAANTALFGSQTTAGTANWAGFVAAGKAFASFHIQEPGKVYVFLTLLAPGTPLTLSAPTLLGNVNFELLKKPTTPQLFNVTDVIFADINAVKLPGVVAGPSVLETVTNEPPHASFTVTSKPSIGPFAFTFNATSSSDIDNTIANPGGYFWDFGDGTQDLGASGSSVVHDYGVNGTFVATLRVQDSPGATGAARDSLGAPIFNSQPSHSSRVIGLDLPPIASFTFAPQNPVLGAGVYFDGTNSTDPDGVIVAYHWDFGDGTVGATDSSPVHFFSSPGSYDVVLTVVDNAGLTGSVSHTVSVTPPIFTSLVVDMDAHTPGVQTGATVSGGFSIGVDVQNVTNLFAWQIQLNYDNSLLSATLANVTLGPFWQSAITNQQGSLVETVNQAIGTLQLNFSLTLQAPRFNGTDVLATVGFNPLRAGSGFLNLFPASLFDTPQHFIPVRTQDGYVVSTFSTGQDEPPTAAFTFSPANASTGATVSFNGIGSFDPDGYIQTWSWSFGDGGTGFGPIVSHSYSSPGNYNVTLTVVDSSGLSGTASAVVQVVFDEPPIAAFTFSPSNPLAGSQVSFDGSGSSDPDGFIQNWFWSFGDGFSSFNYGPYAYHYYNSPGNYTVTLTVNDSSGLSATVNMTIQVHPRPAHDVALYFVRASRQKVTSSESVDIQIGIVNLGTSNETVSVTAYYNSQVIGTLNNVFLYGSSFYTYTVYVDLIWDTSGVAAGNYTISATVFLPADPTPQDNTMTDGQVQVLPPPRVTVTPLSGAPGTMVLVRGSGFPAILQGYYTTIGFVEVTFDDQLIGFTNSRNGSFNFTFSIPLAQGAHLIKALDEITGAHASAGFTVLPQPGPSTFNVSVSVGPIYFPGETAAIFVTTSLNGQLAAVTSLQVVLVRPTGANITLTATPIGTGEWKASYLVPSTASLGTYAVIVRAAQQGSAASSGLVTFEVKQTWLQGNRTTLVTATSLLGVVGVVALAWQRGYFKKKEEDSPLAA